MKNCCRILLLLSALLAQSAGMATTYEYDQLGRLVRESYANGLRIDYSYDEIGNRTSRVVAPPPDELLVDGFES